MWYQHQVTSHFPWWKLFNSIRGIASVFASGPVNLAVEKSGTCWWRWHVIKICAWRRIDDEGARELGSAPPQTRALHVLIWSLLSYDSIVRCVDSDASVVSMTDVEQRDLLSGTSLYLLIWGCELPYACKFVCVCVHMRVCVRLRTCDVAYMSMCVRV